MDYRRLLNRCFRRCLQSVANSFLLLSVAKYGWQMIKYFSLRQRLQLLLEVEYADALAIIFHFIEYGVSLFLSVQMYWLRVVECRLFSFRKLLV